MALTISRVLRRGRKAELASDPPLAAAPMWRYYARRVVARRLTVDLGMRLLGSKILAGSPFARYLAHNLDINDIQRILSHVRGLRGWIANWQAVANERAAQGEKLLAAGNAVSAARCFYLASFYYHFAQVILFTDLDLKTELHNRAVACYAQAAPCFNPPAMPVSIPLGEQVMPGYLRLPVGVERPPVVININGASMIKEEFHTWENEMLARGVATLSYDGPGSGQSWYNGLMMVPDYQQVSRALLDFLAARPEVDGTRVGIMGVSLGGYLGLWLAAGGDPRYRALVTVCAPYHLARDYRIVMPLVRHEIQYLFNFDRKQISRMLKQPVARAGLGPHVRAATLVIGGGRDAIVPPRNARLIFDHLTCEKELLYYPESGHICYDHTTDVRIAAADWLTSHLSDKQ